MNSIAHIEINVSNLDTSKKFYKLILAKLNWKILDIPDWNAGCFSAPDKTHLYIVQTEKIHLNNMYHRKNTGLNHFSFRVSSKEEVDNFATFLKNNNISTLYHDIPKDYSSEYGMEEYYAIFFEDPDRIKLEVVYIK